MYKIILVDDDVTTVEGMKRHIPFKELGIELVAEAYNGKDGLEAIKKHRPDIIFSDIQMPLMTGFEMISCLHELNISPQIIMFTGFNDFDNAKLAIDANVCAYLVKPAAPDEIVEALKKAVGVCEKRLEADGAVRRCMVDGLMRGADCDVKSAETYGIDVNARNFACIQLSFRDTETFLSESFVKEFQAEFSKNGFGIYAGNPNERAVSFLVTSAGEISESVIENIIEKFISAKEADVFATTGNTVGTAAEIPDSYKSACELRKYAFCYNNKGVLTMESSRNMLEHSVTREGLLDKSALYTAVTFNNAEALKKIIDGIESTLRGNVIYDPQKIRTVAFDFCCTVISQNKNGLSDANERDIWREINEISSHDELFEYCRGIVMQFKIRTSLKNPHEEEMTAEIMLKYVEENYMNQISLVQLSKMLFCSRNYLRTVFLKHVGSDFKSYLQEYRMKKAGELLRTTHDNFMVIAEKVGYHDMKTFRQVFASYYGMLPSEYRQKNP